MLDGETVVGRGLILLLPIESQVDVIYFKGRKANQILHGFGFIFRIIVETCSTNEN